MKNWVIALLILTILVIGCDGKSGSLTPAPDQSVDHLPREVSQGNGEKPVSVPDASPREGGVPLLVHFWDGGSYDPDGQIVGWSWLFGDASGGDAGWHGAGDTQGETWHQYTSPGIKVAQLWVVDNDQNYDVAFVKIEMKQGDNANPIAIASADPTAGHAPLTVDFSAAGSYDPDGSIVKYEWDFGEGGGYEDFTDTGGVATHNYIAEGIYSAYLRVTDDDGAESMDTVEITVSGPLGAPGDWWMFGREPTHSRRSPFTGPTTNALKWSYTTGGYVVSSAAICDDGTTYVGCGDGKLCAFNPDGTLKWTYSTSASVWSSPAIGADGTVYVGSLDSNLYAINPDGTPKWIYATYGGIPDSSPAIGADGTIYIGTTDNMLCAINPDGTQKWAFPTGNDVYSSPAIAADGTVYVGCNDDTLYAINPDGTQKWSFITGGLVVSSPAIGEDGTVYFGSYDNKLYAINPDGTLQWSYTTGSFVRSSPAIGADGTIYVGSFDQKLYAINADGTLKWNYTTGGRVYSSPAIDAEGTIYIGSYDQELYAINADGTLKWSYSTGNIVGSSPVVGADGTVYIGSYDHNLYAIGPGEGS